MENGEKPATKQDLAGLKQELLTAIQAAIQAAIQDSEARVKQELLEGMRDIETNLLKGFFSYTEVKLPPAHTLKLSTLRLA